MSKPHWAGNSLTVLLQLPATIAILVWVPTNLAKLVALIALWTLSFRRVSRAELIFFCVISAFFTLMNSAALAQGIFAFRYPDILRMPLWELPMWGFYTLHTMRLIGGPLPTGPRLPVWILAVLFALSFATLSDGTMLLWVTSGLLVVALSLFHEPYDLAYMGYMIVLGAAIEYTGVHSGLWFYPGHPPGGVPLWFITLWGGVGLFLRRLALPIVDRYRPA
jgi:hypothetical protein